MCPRPGVDKGEGLADGGGVFAAPDGMETAFMGLAADRRMDHLGRQFDRWSRSGFGEQFETGRTVEGHGEVAVSGLGVGADQEANASPVRPGVPKKSPGGQSTVGASPSNVRRSTRERSLPMSAVAGERRKPRIRTTVAEDS